MVYAVYLKEYMNENNLKFDSIQKIDRNKKESFLLFVKR